MTALGPRDVSTSSTNRCASLTSTSDTRLIPSAGGRGNARADVHGHALAGPQADLATESTNKETHDVW